MFLSEEKKQKTFTSPPPAKIQAMSGIFRWRSHKSLLLVFFRKAGLFAFLAVQAMAAELRVIVKMTQACLFLARYRFPYLTVPSTKVDNFSVKPS